MREQRKKIAQETLQIQTQGFYYTPSGQKAASHPQSGNICGLYLKGIGFPADRIEHIKQCILTHRFRSKTPPVTIEAKILFDADKEVTENRRVGNERIKMILEE